MKTYLLALSFLCCQACVSVKAPPLIDRQTILETDASAEWPEFEKKIGAYDRQMGPHPLAHEPLSKKKKKVYTTLAGPLQLSGR